jgi:hypothetical protein
MPENFEPQPNPENQPNSEELKIEQIKELQKKARDKYKEIHQEPLSMKEWEFGIEIKDKLGDEARDYKAFHLLIGSTIHPDKVPPNIDFEGDYSVEKFY